MKKTILYISVVLGFLMALVVIASYKNLARYYVTSSEGAVEIWRGTFSPAGRKRLVIMAGVQPPQPIKPLYNQTEVFALISNYYIEIADDLMMVPGMPDFDGIKSYLNRALDYATTDEFRRNADLRLKRIDRTVLVYKADVAANNGTRSGLNAAMQYLNTASALEPDEVEASLIQKRIFLIKKQLIELPAAEPPASKSPCGVNSIGDEL
ncbi:MAG: hypothetical protein PVG08_02505 [Desulfobacterales bacterium]|jgi:hypothetical protein